MRRFLRYPLLLIMLISYAQAQPQKSSTHGLAFTPQGDIHLLFIFIGFNHTVSAKDLGTPGTDGFWPHRDIPNWAKGRYNQIMDADAAQVGQIHNMTDYYDQMSLGKLTVTGEVFPEQIMVDPVFYGQSGSSMNYNAMAAEAISYINEHYPSYDWSRFDQRKNLPQYRRDNSQSEPDSILDYVIWVFRDHSTSGGNSGGFAGGFTTSFGGDTVTYKLRHGHQLKGDKNNPSAFRFVNIHELGHNLYNAPHYGAANQVTGSHFTLHSGSGMMTENGFYNCANAWERWYLGWTDITHDLTSVKDNGTYVLRDFITTGESIRIRIPHSDQHLWLEYHGLQSVYDRRRAFKEDKQKKPIAVTPEGVLVYVEDFSPDRSTTGIFSHGANGMKVLHPDGFYDYAHKGYRSEPGWWVDFIDFEKEEVNPVSGNAVHTWVRGDFDTRKGGRAVSRDQDGAIAYSRNLNYGEYSEQQPVVMLDDQWVYGGMTDITFTTGDRIAMDEPVMALPIPRYQEKYARETAIALNGLVLTFEKVREGYEVTVRFNETSIDRNARYCGNIVLRNIPGAKDGIDLHLLPKTTLRIDKSGTPNRHTEVTPESGDFVNPTAFMCEDSAYIKLEPKSTMIVENESTLYLKSGSKLEVMPGAKLIIDGTSSLFIEKGAELILHSGAKLITRKGATVSREVLPKSD